MREITQLYNKPDDSLRGPKWIDDVVPYLMSLRKNDWSNSIIDLPEGAVEMDDKLLLLWKTDQDFTTVFMTESDRTAPFPILSPPWERRSSTTGGARNAGTEN